MIKKFALSECTPISFANNSNSNSMVRLAAGKISIKTGSDQFKTVEAEMKKHPNALFFRAKAIKADEPNSNGDWFSVEELIKSCQTFVGVPFFTNHDNQDVEKARGKIIFAEWIPEEKAIYTISFVDRDAYPHICRSIEEEYVTGVSMGAINGSAEVLMHDKTTKQIQDIVEGDMVISHNGNVNKVIKTHNEFLGSDMYSFKLMTYHKSPLFTYDHPLYTISKKIMKQDTWSDSTYEPTWQKASELNIGDYLLVPSKYKLEDGSSDNNDFYYLVGAYIGDGYLRKDKKGDYESVSFCLGLHETKLAEKIRELLKKYSTSPLCEQVCIERNGIYINVYDRELAKWFGENIGSGSKNKRIKLNINKLGDAISLICGYIDTEGCIVEKSENDPKLDTSIPNFNGIKISSANLLLLEDMQNLLIACNSTSRIHGFERKPSKNSVVNITTFENTLSIGINSSLLFEKSIKYNNLLFDKAKIKAGQSFITTINGLKYMACPIKEINKIKFDEPVYDITVENDESYIANGVAIHNCSVEYSVCNICENKAEKQDEFCSHVKNKKGRKFTGKARNVVTGEVKEFKDELVYERNYGIKFIELSAVVDPACPSCRIQGIIPQSDYLQRVANVENQLQMIKTAAVMKQASKEEIEQIEQALEILESIAINLIKNRKNVEVSFASDLVEILSNLQEWTDELVGAGYGNVDSKVPGVENEPPASSQQETPAPTIPQTNTQQPSVESGVPVGETPVPVASEKNIKPVGNISGSPTKPLVSGPALPIASPVRPKTSSNVKAIKKAQNLIEKITTNGDINMGKRRTFTERLSQKQHAIKVLSGQWQEKRDFCEYIKEMPFISDNNFKISTKQSGDTFIILAENLKNNEVKVWQYEDLNDEDKNVIKKDPKLAAQKLLNQFKNSKQEKLEGVNRMADKLKQASATSVNNDKDIITEKQLEGTGLYHDRTNSDIDTVTEKQLDSKRTKQEADSVTEIQLENAKLNPRTNDEIEIVFENQLNPLRKNEDTYSTTQKQLEDSRTNNEFDEVTEKQLSKTSTPWARTAKRNQAQFKSAKEHMNAVINVMAETAIETGATPKELQNISATLVAGTKARYEFASAILNKPINKVASSVSSRIAFWNSKNVKVASASALEVEAALIEKFKVLASDETIDPDVIVDAVEVVGEDDNSLENINNKIDEKIKKTETEKAVTASVKSELRKALASKNADKNIRDEKRDTIITKANKRNEERKTWGVMLKSQTLASASNVDIKKADTIIEASFSEIGLSKVAERDNKFKKAIMAFANGVAISNNMKIASITNVTISGDTIQIAVQTDSGDSAGSVEIPIGGSKNAPSLDETMPEGDMNAELNNAPESLDVSSTQEPTESAIGAPTGSASPIGQPSTTATTASAKKTIKVAQTPSGGSMPGAPMAPEKTPEVGAPPAEQTPVESLMTGAPEDTAKDETSEVAGEIPTVGEKQMPLAICPECSSSDVDVTNEDGGVKGKCNACGAEYEGWIEKNLKFKIVKPSNGEQGAETPEEPATPEVPALPVAASTKINKNSLVRIAKNKNVNGHVCPACGNKNCKASKESKGHTECQCNICQTAFQKDIVISTSNPEDAMLMVKWDLVPNTSNCTECAEKAQKFASKIKMNNMLKTASKNKDSFPMANCIERVARTYGGDTVATFGPCKGKLVAECACKQLQTLGFTKVHYMNKLAKALLKTDPMDECLKDQKEKGFSLREASTVCNCIKKKFAKKDSDNIFVHAFAEDIESGKDTSLTMTDLDTLNDILSDIEELKSKVEDKINETDNEFDKEIGDELEPLDEVELDVDVENDDKTSEEVEIDVDDVSEEVSTCKKCKNDMENCTCGKSQKDSSEEDDVKETIEFENNTKEEGKDMDKGNLMQASRVRRSDQSSIRLANKPTLVESLADEVKVPRGKATIGNEGADNIDVKVSKPSVPRGKATMGNEGADNIDVKMDELDVTVGKGFMGKEKEIQKDMPPINNKIKGTVIANKMKVVDTIEQDVKVPRGKATMGNEGADNIDVKVSKPEVPRGNAAMGNEGADNIDVKMKDLDIPIGNGFMGEEKEIQKDMPPINTEYLSNVSAKRQLQQERIAMARRESARDMAAWLASNGRIASDKATFDSVVQALSSFEVDKIQEVAEKMFPAKLAQKIANNEPVGHLISGISLTPKNINEETLATKLANSFTIGSKKFNDQLKDSDIK